MCGITTGQRRKWLWTAGGCIWLSANTRHATTSTRKKKIYIYIYIHSQSPSTGICGNSPSAQPWRNETCPGLSPMKYFCCIVAYSYMYHINAHVMPFCIVSIHCTWQVLTWTWQVLLPSLCSVVAWIASTQTLSGNGTVTIVRTGGAISISTGRVCSSRTHCKRMTRQIRKEYHNITSMNYELSTCNCPIAQ